MSPAILTTLALGFFGFLLSGLMSIVVFFAVRLIKTIDKLTTVVERMDKELLKVDIDMNAHAGILEAHAAQIGHLSSHRCSSEGCPFFDHDITPIPRSARTRATDAGLA